MKLSILDQSPVSEGCTPAEAIAQTASLAREADRLGYHRFWVSEHHAARGLAGSSPEILMTHLAAITSNIRIGSGAVLLPHYSAYKVAENFRVLEALYPGRIDLGLGRAAGGGALAARALQENRTGGAELYELQIRDLLSYLYGGADETHRFAGLEACPEVSTAPELWLLGSSGDSAALAAKMGVRFAYAAFINSDGGGEAVHTFQTCFHPSPASHAPRALVSVFAVCAETSAEADRLAASMDLSVVLLEKGHVSTGIPSVETALSYNYTPYDRFRIEENRKRTILGSPEEVRQKFISLMEEYRCEEIMFAMPMHRYEDKLKSLRLIAGACGLSQT
ncbi:LLM class flavin-dependent oxidoreductase [Paenibacillus sp. sgz5001063]|uniref:LLM class flavin-dependent oxidoreductase n=1 Tax=Paenibacillus sp. sgz5001063 TaxID=3242474 RepID=UPI0036D38D90